MLLASLLVLEVLPLPLVLAWPMWLLPLLFLTLTRLSLMSSSSSSSSLLLLLRGGGGGGGGGGGVAFAFLIHTPLPASPHSSPKGFRMHPLQGFCPPHPPCRRRPPPPGCDPPRRRPRYSSSPPGRSGYYHPLLRVTAARPMCTLYHTRPCKRRKIHHRLTSAPLAECKPP